MMAPPPWVAKALAVGSAVLALVDTVVVAQALGLWSSTSIGIHGWPLVDVASVGAACLGAVIVSSQPRQPIGWLLTAIGFVTSLSLVTESYATWVLFHDGPGSTRLAEVCGWLASFTGGVFSLGALAVTFVLVPSGRVMARGWWTVAAGAGLGYASYTLGLLIAGPHDISHQDDGTVQVSQVASVFLSLGVLAILLAVLGSVVCLLIRLRRSRGQERLQLRVVALGAGSVGVSFAVLLASQAANGGHQAVWSSILLYAAYAGLCVCIAVAVLRYRLYDVEIFVSRTVVVALAAAFAAAGYVGIVVLLARAVGDRTGGFWLSLVAMVVVALAFQPLRRAAVRLADRLAYGSRAAPYDELAEFSRRIGRSPAPGELLPTIAAAAGEAVDAGRVVVRMRVEAGPDRSCAWPTGTDEAADPQDLVVPVADAGGTLGSIEVGLRSGRGVRPFERRLLQDIADQAAVAFRNVRLQVELAARVEQLDRRAQELTSSRNRLIGAADTERRRLESAVGREVLPAMTGLRAALVDCSSPTPDAGTIAGFVDQATVALESLRQLTRGIYPTMLTRSGLGPALTSYASRQQLTDALTIAPAVTATRYPEPVETAAYYCCVEALTHGTAPLTVTLTQISDDLVVSVSGLDLNRFDRVAVRDRIEACGGTLDVVEHSGGATVRARLPGGISVSPSPRATPVGVVRG